MSLSPTAPRTTEDLCERFGPPEDLTVKHKLPYIDEVPVACAMRTKH
jgi:hypothetical protein